MKNNKLLLVIFILIAITAGYYIYQTKYSTVRQELRDFAVKDTANITKFFLADRNGNSITLTKQGQQWLLNDKMKARRSNILNLLEVIYRVDVRTKVAKAAYNNVIKGLASSAIKCEIYLNNQDKPSKVIYVGGQTEDGMGTFMMLENSNSPFITQIPGFNGYLTPRFNPILNDWKEPLLFSYAPGELKSIEISYANFPENSFRLTEENGRRTVTALDGSQPIQSIDTIACINYFDMYRIVYYETMSNLKKEKVDSITSLPPSIIIKAVDKKNQSIEVDIYRAPVSKSSLAQLDTLGNPLKFDIDRVYGFIKPDNILTTIQQQAIEKLFRRKSDFDLNKAPMRR
jgi:hypothetical protein